MNDMTRKGFDGLNMAPRPGEPESALLPGMAAPAPNSARGGPPGVEALDMPDTSGPGPTAVQSPGTWVYDFDPANGMARATFNGEVNFTSGGSATAGVTSWNTRTGAVSLTLADITAVGGAPLNSPTFLGANANTPPPGDSTTKVATTMFVSAAIAATPLVASFNGRQGAVALTIGDVTSVGGAPLASPAFSGVPTAPTAAQGTASGQVASTQFVANALASGAVTNFNGRTGAVNLTLSDVTSVGGAPVASPNFTGAPTGPTPTVGDASTKLATTAFVTNAITGATTGVASFNTRTGAVVLTPADVTSAGGAPIVSPNFSGTPTAPTPTAGDTSTKVATTAFVATAIGAMAPAVASFNSRTGAVVLTIGDVTGVGGAPIASPALTGAPSAPTPTAGDNSTKIATTAFVAGGFITPAQVAASYAPIASPTFTGTPAAPTPALADASTKVATTAFVRQGVTDGSDAAAGQVGEFKSVDGALTLSVGSGGLQNVCQFTLTAGDWDVSGLFAVSNASATLTGTQAAISISNSSMTPIAGNMGVCQHYSAASMGGCKFAMSNARLSVSATTTLFLMAQINFTGSPNPSVYGSMYARRAR